MAGISSVCDVCGVSGGRCSDAQQFVVVHYVWLEQKYPMTMVHIETYQNLIKINHQFFLNSLSAQA